MLESLRTMTYVAYIQAHAVRNAQYASNANPEETDWIAAPSARIYVGLFVAHSTQDAMEKAAAYMKTDPKNIGVLPAIP